MKVDLQSLHENCQGLGGTLMTQGRATELELALGFEMIATCWVAWAKSEMIAQLPMFFDFWKLSSLLAFPA